MKATEFAKMSMENGANWVLTLIDDMKETPFVQPTSNGGNHPLWILGHLAHSESFLFDVFVLGKENRFPELGEKFGPGSQPTTSADDYPSYEELLGKFKHIREVTLAHLATLSDDDLDAKSHVPEEYAAMFGTVGACYASMSTHVMFHGGQVADARRAAGKPVLGM